MIQSRSFTTSDKKAPKLESGNYALHVVGVESGTEYPIDLAPTKSLSRSLPGVDGLIGTLQNPSQIWIFFTFNEFNYQEAQLEATYWFGPNLHAVGANPNAVQMGGFQCQQKRLSSW